MFFNIAITIAAAWMLFIGSIFNVKRLASVLFFKLVPLILGVVLLIFSMKQFNLT